MKQSFFFPNYYHIPEVLFHVQQMLYNRKTNIIQLEEQKYGYYISFYTFGTEHSSGSSVQEKISVTIYLLKALKRDLAKCTILCSLFIPGYKEATTWDAPVKQPVTVLCIGWHGLSDEELILVLEWERLLRVLEWKRWLNSTIITQSHFYSLSLTSAFTHKWVVQQRVCSSTGTINN